MSFFRIRNAHYNTLQVFPECYKWTSFGITSMLQKFWDAELHRRKHNPTKYPNPFNIEVVSMLERALAFNTTGNAKCIHRGTMFPSFIGKGIVDRGHPAIHRDLLARSEGDTSYTVHLEYWPTVKHGGYTQPLLSSRNGLIFHYSIASYLVRL